VKNTRVYFANASVATQKKFCNIDAPNEGNGLKWDIFSLTILLLLLLFFFCSKQAFIEALVSSFVNIYNPNLLL
jgi:hypothetical protein